MPPSTDFVSDAVPGALRRLLALDCVQDPGNLVRSCLEHRVLHGPGQCLTAAIISWPRARSRGLLLPLAGTAYSCSMVRGLHLSEAVWMQGFALQAGKDAHEQLLALCRVLRPIQ